jgi:hypothetical protein
MIFQVNHISEEPAASIFYREEDCRKFLQNISNNLPPDWVLKANDEDLGRSS